ncbi:MAG: Holliday junction resolvase RuvX [Burkholderiaceae bacterium]|nr:Holliday junction resolvase RuvX [Burkholderiaceae bacterium]
MAETLLGFDFGIRRIGVAVGNTLTGSARALQIVPTEPLAARWSAIAAMVSQWEPQRLVVGRPLHPDGAPLPVTRLCERFARQLGGRFGLPVELIDENFSSVEARALLGRGAASVEGSGATPEQPGLPGARRRDGGASAPVDAEAAAVILRQYLSSRRSESHPPR